MRTIRRKRKISQEKLLRNGILWLQLCKHDYTATINDSLYAATI